VIKAYIEKSYLICKIAQNLNCVTMQVIITCQKRLFIHSSLKDKPGCSYC